MRTTQASSNPPTALKGDAIHPDLEALRAAQGHKAGGLTVSLAMPQPLSRQGQVTLLAAGSWPVVPSSALWSERSSQDLPHRQLGAPAAGWGKGPPSAHVLRESRWMISGSFTSTGSFFVLICELSCASSNCLPSPSPPCLTGAQVHTYQTTSALSPRTISISSLSHFSRRQLRFSVAQVKTKLPRASFFFLHPTSHHQQVSRGQLAK